MSGVIIDVGVNEEPATTSLANINKQLANLVLQAQHTNNILGNLKLDGFKKSPVEIEKTTSALTKLGSVGSTVLNTIVAPLTKTISLFTSLPFLIGIVATSFAAIQGIKAFYKIADDLTIMQNRLRLVLQDTNEFVQVQHELYRISRQSYVSNQNTVESFFALSRSLKSVGTSTADTIGMTKTLQQTMALSGGSTTSLAAGMVQFNQAMASGVLRGDEFNSIMENLPRLAQALTDNLGIAQGKLRTMAESGALSSDILVAALRSQSGKIDEEFKSIVITAEMGVNAVNAAFSNLYQSIVNITNSNTHVAAVLKEVANDIDSFAARILPTFYSITQGFRNYIGELDAFSAVTLTMKQLTAFKISPFDAIDSLRNYTIVKGIIDKYRTELGLAKKETIGFSFGDLKMQVVDINPFKSVIKDKPKLNFKDIFSESISLAVALGHAIEGITSKFHWLIPDIRLPLATVGVELGIWFRQTEAETKAWSIKTLMPFARVVEAFAEFKGYGDHNLERQWVDVFKSSSIKELTSNLNALGRAGNSVRLANISILVNDFFSLAKSGRENILEVLRFLGILENRILFVNNVRFDRAIEGFKTLGSIVKRVYDDVIFPIILPPATAVYLYVRRIALAFAGAVKDNFTAANGEYIGTKIVEGAASGIRKIGGFISNIFTGKSIKIPFSTDDMSDEVHNFFTIAKDTAISIGNFLVGVFKGAFIQLGNEVANAIEIPFERAFRRAKEALFDTFDTSDITDKIFSKLLEGITSRDFKFYFTFDPSHFQRAVHIFDQMLLDIMTKTYGTLSNVEKRIKSFGRFIEDVFFHIYDKVVGHSYWPDMIDGVVDYTSKLFKSQSLISQFKDQVVAIFRDLQKKVQSTGVSGMLTSIRIKLDSIDFGTMGISLRQQIYASLLAAFLLFFGGSIGKYVAMDFFLSSIDDALISIFGKIPDFISSALGEAAGVITGDLLGGMFRVMDTILAAMPKFVASFLVTLGPIGKGVSALLDFGPSNTLLYGIFTGLAIYAAKAKDGLKTLGAFWGGSKDKTTGIKTDGIKDYLSAITGVSTGGMSLMFKAVLGDNPKLLLAGIAAISTAFLSSISIMQAATVGIPLMVLAIFGKEAGGKMLGSVLSFLPMLAWNWVKGLRATAQTARGPVAEAAADLFGTFISAMKNVQKNKALYGAGEISFADMFRGPKPSEIPKTMPNFMGQKFAVPVGPSFMGQKFDDIPMSKDTGNVKDKFRKLYEEILKFEIRGTTIGDIGTQAKRYAFAFYDKVKEYTTQAKDSVLGLWANRSQLASAVASFIAPVKAVFADLFSTIAAGFKFLMASTLNKFTVFLVLLAGIATMAHASSSAVAAMGTNFNKIIATVVILTAALYTLGKISSAALAFKSGKVAFVSEAVNLASGKIATAGATAAEAVMGNASIPSKVREEAARAASEAAMKRATREAEMSAAASFGATSAGFKSMTNDLKATGSQLGSFFTKIFKGLSDAGVWAFTSVWSSLKWLKEGISSKIFNLDSWIYGWTMFRMIAFNTLKVVEFGITAITAGTLRLGVVLQALSFSSLFGLARVLLSAYKAGELLWVVLGKVPAMFRPIIAWAARVGATITLATSGLALAVVGSIGALGLWLFGPGNTLMESLEYYKDKVTSIFGMSATSGAGRKGALADLLPDQNVANVSVKFSAELEKVDLSKMREGDFAAIEKSATATKELLDRLNEAYATQGRLTHEQNVEMQDALKRQHEILNSLPRQEKANLNTTRLNLADSILGKPDNSFMAKSFRMIDLVMSGFANAINDLIPEDLNVLGFRVKSMGADLSDLGDVLNRFKHTVVEIWPEFRGSLESLVEVIGFAVEDIKTAIKHPVAYLSGGLAGAYKQEEIDSKTPGFVDNLKKTVETVTDGVKYLGRELVKAVTVEPSKERKAASAEINQAYLNVQFVQKGLTQEEIDAFNKKMKEYEALAEKYFDKKEKGSVDINGKRYGEKTAEFQRSLEEDKQKMLEAKTQAFDTSGSIDKISEALLGLSEKEAVARGKRKLDIQIYENGNLALEEYAMGFTSFTEKAKEFFSLDFGKKGKDFLGGTDQEMRMKELTRQYMGYLKQLNDGVASSDEGLDIKLNMKSVQKQMAVLDDTVKNSGFLTDTFDFQIKTTGLDLVKQQLTDLYATDKDAYDVWSAAVQKLIDAKTRFEMIKSKGSSPELVAAANADVVNAAKGVQAAAPKTQGITGAITDIGKLGVTAPNMNSWMYLAEGQFSKVKNSLEQAVIAKQRLDSTEKRPFAQYVADLEDMIKKTRIVNEELAKARGIALEKGTAPFSYPSSGDVTRADRLGIIPPKAVEIPYGTRIQNQSDFGTGNVMPAEVAKNDARRRAWLDTDKRLGELKNKQDEAKLSSDEKTIKQLAVAEDMLNKKLARIADVFPDPTNSTMIGAFNSLVSGFTELDYLALPDTIRKSLGDMAYAVAAETDKLTKNPFSESAMREAVKNRIAAEDAITKALIKYGPKSINQENSNLTNAGFNLPDFRTFNRLNDNPEVKALTEEIRRLDSLMGRADLSQYQKEDIRNRREEITQKFIPKINFGNLGFDEMQKQLTQLFPDAGITTEAFSKFGTTLIGLAEDVNAASYAISKLGTSEAERAKAAELYHVITDKQREASRTTAQFSYTSRGEHAMRSAGIDPGSDYKYVDDIADKQLRMLSGKISSALKAYSDAERDDTYTPAARLVAALEIERMQGQLSKALALASMKPENTQAYQAGVAFASDIKSAFSDGMKELLAGNNTPAEIFAKFFDTLAVKITDTFINGAISSMTSEGGLFDNLLKSFGTTLFSGAMKMFGGNNEKDVSVQATKDLIQAIQDLIEIYRDMTGTGAQGPGISTDANGGPNQGISFNTTGDAPSDYSTLAGSNNVYGNGAGMSFKIPKNSTLSSGFGFTDTSSVSSPDLTPTLQTGFSSSVDWLKNLNQTSDSGFGKTVSTLDFLSKISSQGFGGIINMLAMTAGGAGGLFGTALGFITKAIGVFGGAPTVTGATGDFARMDRLTPMATGGSIPGNFGSPIPIMAHGGEVILNPEQQRALILGGDIAGGRKQKAHVFNINITGDVSLQTRQEIVKMIPQIAAGVNSQNYESGFISRR